MASKGLFAALAAFMGEGESLTFSIEPAGDNALRVILQPNLPGEPKGLTDEAKALRGALAKPLIFKGSVEELDADFEQYTAKAGAVRGQVASDFERALESLKDSANKSRAEAAKAKAKSGAAKGGAAKKDDAAKTSGGDAKKAETAKAGDAPEPTGDTDNLFG